LVLDLIFPTELLERFFLDSEFYTEDGVKIDKACEETIAKFVEITEIENRRFIEDDLSNSQIGYEAAKIAIADAKIDQEELDYIIYASNFGEVTVNGYADFMPTMAARVKTNWALKTENVLLMICFSDVRDG
jgi:3-oxoacyl-[acyl-carrier-protein] synthase-3